jgi:drug/metabolite transporter (DMT)-like permease
MSLVPPMTAVLAWLVLGETLTPRQCLGMAMTVGGVLWVVRERIPDAAREARHPPARGVLLGLGGAVGQAVGLVLSKHGMGDYDAFASNQIRILAGSAGFAVIFTVTRLWPRFVDALRQRPAMARTLLGATFGPFLGVSLSLVAVQNTVTGVAATIMSITPVIILPASHWLRRERVSVRAVAGALLAVLGTAVLFS